MLTFLDLYHFPLRGLEQAEHLPRTNSDLKKISALYFIKSYELRRDRLVLEDSRDIKAIQDLNAFNMLIDLLPERIGSPLSINSIANDLGRPFNTIKSWIEVLETLYFCFRIKPYSKKIIRSLRSEAKLYFYDHIPVTEESKRLENLCALCLLKAAYFWTETAQANVELFYLRDKEKREGDFLLVKNHKPWILVECKSTEKELDPSLIYYREKVKPEHCVQLVNINNFERNYPHYKIKVMSYEKFFSGLI